MLDKIDYQIINALRTNGRYSNNRLANKLGINVATVAKRIDTMLKEDVISFKAVPNPYKMGRQSSAVLTLYVDLSRVDKVCSYLVDNPNISLVQTAFGRYDVLLIADYCNFESLHNFIKNDLTNLEGIQKINTFLVSEIKKRYEGIFEDSHVIAPVHFDTIDQLLMEELEKNGRASFTHLANMFGVSLATVSRRVNSLLDENIIKITAVTNPSKLGFSSNAFIFIQAELPKINDICENIYRFPEVHLIMTLLNGYEILAGVNCPNPEELFSFLKDKIARINGISNIETYIRAEIKKRYYGSFEIFNHFE